MILFGEEYLCKCNQEHESDTFKKKAEFYISLWKEAKLTGEKYLVECDYEPEFDTFKKKVAFYKSLLKVARLESRKERNTPEPYPIDIQSEGRQVFTRWNWSYPNRMTLRSKRFSIKYEKPLSAVEKLLLHNFQKKYLYHAINDVLDSLKSQPLKRDNLLAILYSTVLSLQNNFLIDFFDIWIDEVYIQKLATSNKFLRNGTSNFEPSTYITLKLVYNKKLLPKKPEAFW